MTEYLANDGCRLLCRKLLALQPTHRWPNLPNGFLQPISSLQARAVNLIEGGLPPVVSRAFMRSLRHKSGPGSTAVFAFSSLRNAWNRTGRPPLFQSPEPNSNFSTNLNSLPSIL